MSKLLIKILIAFVTFSIGISIYFFWNLSLTSLPQIEIQENEIIARQFLPIKITACQVLDIPESYNGKLIS